MQPRRRVRVWRDGSYCFPLEEHLLTNLLRHPDVEAVPSQFVDVLPIPDKGFA